MVSSKFLLASCSWLSISVAISLNAVFDNIFPSKPGRTVNGADNNIYSTPEHDTEFTVFSSNIDEAYSLRIKPLDPESLGVDAVKQWSGYLDHEDSKHFFYWFFESRNDPETDPVILWLNGGPGCSSFVGLFFELGPSTMGADLKPIYNPYSWNSNASVIFLDQPVGVGFSYGDSKVSTTDDAARDVYIFLDLFFERFPQLRANDFHISGESYAGHYLPKIAHEIAIVHAEDSTFNLSSVLIGNGFTDPLTQYSYYQPMACGEGGYPSVLQPDDCLKMNKNLPVCLSLVNRCYKSHSTFSCVLADRYCEQQITTVYEKSGRNFYDIRAPCELNDDSGACYKEEVYISDYLNQEEVQRALGTDVSTFQSCSSDVGIGFAFTGDGPNPFQQYVAELLDQDIHVLIYAGDKDYICNWLGNLAWTDDLDWKFHAEYQQQLLRKWKSEETEETIGQTKSYGPLSFLRIYDAGHMVPHDQPANSLQMVNSWIRDVAKKSKQ
ncbi:unnamed protein product [Kluyveromyces dobzhanskii CBS 2104]|uniref:Carboxypeptidase n=1 Tax=Kluyveromyces dobzhanskii CBS 2104 TaxID=1427455 RepID=A0A0A8L9T6_9SACH|nr:unnamed protein product [Kluyveromyces dobzhanskii CBS 2104]